MEIGGKVIVMIRIKDVIVVIIYNPIIVSM